MRFDFLIYSIDSNIASFSLLEKFQVSFSHQHGSFSHRHVSFNHHHDSKRELIQDDVVICDAVKKFPYDDGGSLAPVPV